MYQRGHQVPDSGRRSHRKKDKEHYSRSAQQERDLNYPMSDQHWDRPDARYMSHFTSPPARAQLLPYNSQEYAYGYGWQEHHRPQSRSVLHISYSKQTLQIYWMIWLLQWTLCILTFSNSRRCSVLSKWLFPLYANSSIVRFCKT